MPVFWCRPMPPTETSIRQWTMETAKDIFLVTSFCELEVFNALELRLFRKEMSREVVDACAENFRGDLRARVFDLRAVPESAFKRARGLYVSPRLD